MSCWQFELHAKTTIIRTLIIIITVQKIIGGRYATKHHLKTKRKIIVKKKRFLAPDGVMCLYMRLKRGQKTLQPAGQRRLCETA